MMNLRIVLASRLPLYMILGGLISMHACKNKKQLAEISDGETVKAQIEEELSRSQPTPETTRVTATLQPTRTADEPRTEEELTRSQRVSRSMDQVATAADYASANRAIDQTLAFFSSPDSPVLIIVYQNGDDTEYDEPTTISKYLHYLKDTRNKPARVEEIVTDEAGKIKELVLRKN